MHSASNAANRFVAALWFWLPPLFGITAYSAVTIFGFGAYAKWGPTYQFKMMLMLVATVTTVNALGFMAAVFLCPPVRRQHARRLYAFSVMVGFACYFASLLVMELTSSLGVRFDELRVLALILAAFMVSAAIGLLALRAALLLGLLQRSSISSVCSNCGYDLRASPGRRCPECGVRA